MSLIPDGPSSRMVAAYRHIGGPRKLLLQRGLLCIASILILGLAADLAHAQRNVLRESETLAAPTTAPPSAPPAQAVDPSVTEVPKSVHDLTPAMIEDRRKQAEGSTDLDEEAKKRIADLYRQAAEQLKVADERAAQSVRFRANTETVQQSLATIRQELEQVKQRQARLASAGRTDFEPEPLPESEVDRAAPDGMDLDLRVLKQQLAKLVHERTQLQQELAKRQLRLQELKEAQTKAEAARAGRPNRKQEIRSQQLAIPERLQGLSKQLEAAPPADEPPLLTLAKRTELQARRLAVERDLPALQAELAAYEAEDAVSYLTLHGDLITQRTGLAALEITLLEARLKETRDTAETLAVRIAESEAIQSQPLLRPHAERNAELTKAALSLTPLIDEADARRKEAREALDNLKRRSEQTEQKVETVGLTHAIGAMLRKERNALPVVRRRRSDIRNRQDTIDEAQIAFYQYDEELADLTSNQTRELEMILANVPSDLAPEAKARLKDTAEHVLDRQKQNLAALRGSYNTYFDTLVDLSSIEQQIIRLTREFATYIDERVLWIRSSKPLTSNIHLDDSDVQFFVLSHWSRIATKIWSDIRRNPSPYVSVLVVLGALVHLGRRFRRELREIGERVGRGSFHHFGPTMRAALLTMLLSIPWPCLLLFVAWSLTAGANGTAFAGAMSNGCYAVALGFFPLELFRQLCRSGGLAAAHFDWPASALAILRSNLKFLMIFALPLVFVTAALFASDTVHGFDFVERCGFILTTLVLAAFLRRILHPKHGVFQEYIAYHSGGWIDHLRYVWYWLGVASPLVLGTLAFTGYYYTATQLSWRLFLSGWLVVSLLVVRACLLRLLLVQRRRMSMQQLRERRESASTSADALATTTLSPQSIVPTDPANDLKTQTLQSRRLLSTGLTAIGLLGIWLAWADVLPALSLLDRWPLWTTTVTVTETIEMTDGSPPETRSRDVPDPVTIADLALGIMIAIMTLIAARNIPGLTEMAVLQRLPLDNSVRYAITTLVSYAIAFIGIMVACRVIGLRWQQIQWLATALTFGLAFGLQEMFANFVAGIILLFERPIRVGDVVTIDDVTGIVSRIRIRATTITNWDRKDFVVPNKEFITGRLLNWTLSDQINRIVIEVGIAYGSDTEQARELLLKVAKDHPMTIDDPPTMACFEGFGDSSLKFTLRTFLPSLENRLNVIHELYTGIDQAFRAAALEISFPQRDLHIRSLPQSVQRSLGGPSSERASVA